MRQLLDRYNRLYIKVTLLVGLLLLLALGAIIYRGTITKKATAGRVLQYRQEKIDAFKSSIDSSYDLERIFARDYTVWDEMVASVQQVDHKWLAENIDSGVETYRTTDAWVLDKSYKTIYSATKNTLSSPPIDLAKNHKELFNKGYFVDFFTTNNDDIYKVFIAPIQPTADVERQSQPQGYLIVANKLDADFIDRVEKNSAIDLRLRRDGQASEGDDLNQGLVRFTQPMTDWRGQTIAHYSATVNSTFLKSLVNDYNYQYLIFAYGLLVVMLAVGFIVQVMVARPMRHIADAIKKGQSKHMNKLLTRGDELGDMARLVRRNLDQNDELKAAYALKQKAESNAQQRSSQMERVNNLMVGRELRMVELKRQVAKLKKRLAELGDKHE